MLWRCRSLPAVTIVEPTLGREADLLGLRKEPAITHGATETSGTRSRSVCSAHARFRCRPQRLRLRAIELFAILGMFLSAMTAQMPSPGEPALDITVSVIRQSHDLVKINYVLRNKGTVDLYLPCVQIAGTLEITTYSLLHRSVDGGWIDLGPRYDVGSRNAQILEPGKSVSLTQLVSDPSEVALKGTGKSLVKQSIALRGPNKIRVEYYSGEAEWKQRLAVMKQQQDSQRTLKPAQPQVAYSQEFEIPPGTK